MRPSPPRLLLCTHLALAGLAAGCADDLEPAADPDAAPGGGEDGAPAAGKVSTARNDDGSYTTTVDATSMDEWTTFDLESGVEAEPAIDGPWDLAAQRFHLKLNGGASGGGGVRVARLADVAFDAVDAAPADGWITDEVDGDDDGDDPDYAFEQDGGWYAYDGATHILTPYPYVWVLETAEGAYLKLAIADYYDDAGTSGTFTLNWAPVDPPAGVAP